MSDAPTLVHGTCVAIGGVGILLRGPSGAGKSDLALRLIDGGARLVADDQVALVRLEQSLVARPAPNLAGLLEVRGLGLLRLNYEPEVPLFLVVDLVTVDQIERLPDPQSIRLLDCDLPLLRLEPFAAAAPAKLRLAVRVASGSIMRAR